MIVSFVYLKIFPIKSYTSDLNVSKSHLFLFSQPCLRFQFSVFKLFNSQKKISLNML